MQKLYHEIRSILISSVTVSTALFKIMIPILILVKILEELGAIQILSAGLEPLMLTIGLPGACGLVWATALFLNIYAGMLVLVTLNIDMTVAQITILSTMILVAHNIPIEVAITKKAGSRFITMALIRIVSAYIMGMLLHIIYSATNSLNTPNKMIWDPSIPAPGLLSWVYSQIYNLFSIYLIILILLCLMKLMDLFHINRALSRLLAPILKLMGIGRQATTITLVGITLGLAYGGGLIIDEAKSGTVSHRDVFYSLTLMGLSHSLIEDTLLMVVLGAHLSGILWGRMFFSFIFVILIVKLLNRVSDQTFRKYFAAPPT